MKLRLFYILVFACVALTGASANTITFNFATTPNASLGTNTFTYTSDGLSITAKGSTDLYYKVATGTEIGLGLACCDGDHEINPGQSIVFDLSSLFSQKVTGLTLTLGSIQPGETGSVCAGSNCISFNSSENGQQVSILSLYFDMLASHSGKLTITGAGGDILIDQLQVTTTTVPEPGSLLLLGTGLFMMATTGRFLLRQRHSKTL